MALVKPLNWLLYHTRLLVIPELVRRHPQLRQKLLLAGLFFSGDNILFYLLVIGLLAGVIVNPWWLLLMVPYTAWVMSFRSRGNLLMRIPRRAARVPVFVVRHMVVCASLLYGSFRSRTLVL